MKGCLHIQPKGDGIVDCKSKTFEESRSKFTSNYIVRGEMQIMRLDDVGPVRDVKALKMDVEGHEPYVVQGAKNFFRRRTVWFMVTEFNKHMLSMPDGRPQVDFIIDIIK